MNDKKFEEFGNKINVKPTDLANNKPSIWVKKLGFFIVQAITLAVASIFGFVLGFLEHSYQSYYPFYSGVGFLGGLGLVGISVTNGRISIKREPAVGKTMKKGVKISIVLVTAILSLTVYLPMFGLTASSDELSGAILYNVYAQKKGKN